MRNIKRPSWKPSLRWTSGYARNSKNESRYSADGVCLRETENCHQRARRLATMDPGRIAGELRRILAPRALAARVQNFAAARRYSAQVCKSLHQHDGLFCGEFVGPLARLVYHAVQNDRETVRQ